MQVSRPGPCVQALRAAQALFQRLRPSRADTRRSTREVGPAGESPWLGFTWLSATAHPKARAGTSPADLPRLRGWR